MNTENSQAPKNSENTAHSVDTVSGLLYNIYQLGGPIFLPIAVLVPFAAMTYAMFFSESILILNYVHVMCGVLWTGFDLFMGFILGPILGQLPEKDRAEVFKRLIPKITFLFTTLAIVTSTTGVELVKTMGYPMDRIFDFPWIVAGLVIATLLGIQALFFLIPNEIRILRQLLKENPNTELINRLGMRNAKLAGLQGILQISIIFVMANIRF